jgi:formate hydrogenlyase subunit 6/NADH:ubiquinone oxidoreductase subunit I
MHDVYERLRAHLDRLPAGFPSTEEGIELRLLKRLFSVEEAEMACHVTMRLAPADKIAAAAGLDPEKAAARLAEMSRKGLVFSIESPDRPPVYMASQYVVGIWEYHVNDLDREFVADNAAYFPRLAKEAFDHLPQLRTIPVDQSIDAGLEVLPHEQAEQIVKDQKKFVVAPCICRREHQLMEGGCDKLMDACLIFGWGAEYYLRNGLGREISLEETLAIIRLADEEGLVLQPSNAEEIVNICCCCGDCCQVLINLKRHPVPADAVSSPFIAALDEEACSGCETCVERCQMDALEMSEQHVVLTQGRCIGCGLCVSTCLEDAIRLVRKPAADQPVVPKNQKDAFSMRAKARAAAKSDLEDKVSRHHKI